MSDEIVVIDRRTFKLMKCVYRHDHVSLSVLDKRFGKKIDSVSAIISYLCHSHYGAYRSPGKSWSTVISILAVLILFIALIISAS